MPMCMAHRIFDVVFHVVSCLLRSRLLSTYHIFKAHWLWSLCLANGWLMALFLLCLVSRISEECGGIPAMFPAMFLSGKV